MRQQGWDEPSSCEGFRFHLCLRVISPRKTNCQPPVKDRLLPGYLVSRGFSGSITELYIEITDEDSHLIYSKYDTATCVTSEVNEQC